MKKIMYTLAATFLLVVQAMGQPFNVDLNFALGSPQGSFHTELGRNSYGLDGTFTIQLFQTPFHAGVGFTYQNFGWKEREAYFNAEIPEVLVTVRTTNNMVTPHLLLRWEAPFGPVRPFAEGILGFNYLYTESSVKDNYSDEDIASTINYDYTTSSAGLGGGIKFRLYEGFDDDGDFIGLHLITKGRFLFGGEAWYLKEGDLVRSGNGLQYNERKSRTDLATFSIGVVFNF